MELAASLGAGRVEIAHAQYYGWALRNRQALMPTPAQVHQAMQDIESIRPRYADRLVIDMVVPDYYARRPKACMGGWARRSLNVVPSGRVLPCHAAETIPGLEFWSVRDHSLAGDLAGIASISGVSRHRLDARSRVAPARCERSISADAAARRWHFAGDAAATDPACELSPHPCAMMRKLAESDASAADARISVSRAARPLTTGYCHSSSLKAAVALRAL